MDNKKMNKTFCLLRMHERLSKGETIANDGSLPAKTFHRYISSLRCYYAEQENPAVLVFDRKKKCFRLKARPDRLTKKEIFAVCKVLIESRAFNKTELNTIINKLLLFCEKTVREQVKKRIRNEQVNYVPLQHNKPLTEILWMLANCVSEQQVIKIAYKRLDGTSRNHEVKPVGIMFSEFYFYLIAYMADDSKDSPTIFRIDRIIRIDPKDVKFQVPYKEIFDETEFRRRVQFMYAGELRRVRFRYKGNLEAALDRLPTAIVERREDDGAVVIRAEAYGKGIDMWLGSQGDKVEVL